ncbi:hypothetical protein B4072_1526 [Bacillus subtilis]|nr:hypothetical protein B4069_1803 [Bacillus subtilis]KIN48643.1 hypothetical protein B4072_1526 [Bacillus subtilis]
MNKFPYNFQKKIKNMVEFRFIFLYIKNVIRIANKWGGFTNGKAI